MRQVGVLCAAAYVAVRDTVGKLADDHRKAKALAGFKILVVFSFFLSFESNFTSFLLCTVHKH
jgi:threonine aldolase